MNESTHTPGPWEIHNNIGRKGKLGIVANGAPCIIAIMGNSKEWPIEAQANAQLIAQAPAMLDALKLLCGILKDARFMECEEKLPGLYRAWCVGNDVISKATEAKV